MFIEKGDLEFKILNISMLSSRVCASLKLNKELLLPCKYLPEISVRITGMSTCNPVESSIRTKLNTNLQTVHLNVINESYMHNVPKGSETHFKVVVVSEKFSGLPLIKRHRLVNDLLKDELSSGVHALSIVAKTPDQWTNSDQKVEPSPNCRGGFGK